jgi:hypothetical protein
MWHRIRGVLEEEFEDIYELLRELELRPPLPDADGLVVFFGADIEPVHAKWTWNGRSLSKIIELALRQTRQ